jgi:hypothetical protein
MPSYATLAAMDLRSLFLPEPRRRLPHARAWNVGSRTVHLAATGTLLGGHVFGVPADTLLPWLWAALASGALLLALELYTSFDWLTQGGGLTLLLKLALLCAIPFAWPVRVLILFGVVAIAGIGSHMPGKYRHYSVVYRRVIK